MVSNGLFIRDAEKTMVMFMISMIIVIIILIMRIAIFPSKIISTPYKILENEVDKNVGKN